MASRVTESIWSDDKLVIAMALVQHIEKLWHGDEPNGLWLITEHTRWDHERGSWENPVYVPQDRAEAFLRDWCRYRAEIERAPAIVKATFVPRRGE